MVRELDLGAEAPAAGSARLDRADGVSLGHEREQRRERDLQRYSVDDEDQPQGDGDSLVSDRGLDRAARRGLLTAGEVVGRRGLRQHARTRRRPARRSTSGSRRRSPSRTPTPRRPPRARTSAARSAPSAPAGWSTRTRASAPTWSRTWSARTSASTAPARAPRRPPSTSSRTEGPPDAPRQRSAGRQTRRLTRGGGLLVVDAPLAGVGEPGLLRRLRLELRAAGGLQQVPGRLVVARAADQVGGAALEPLQRRRAKICCSVAVRSERPRPRKLTAQCSEGADPVLEAGQVDAGGRRATSARR